MHTVNEQICTLMKVCPAHKPPASEGYALYGLRCYGEMWHALSEHLLLACVGHVIFTLNLKCGV